ncbi:MAG: MFS transporter [Phycisphaerales bacterium]|nr:MAG: MFS transporter [Phycisphaerales bacterium]
MPDPTPPEQAARKAYTLVFNDDELDNGALPEAAKSVPRNFFLNVFNGGLTKLAEQLASPGLVLAWLIGAVGAPAAFAGLLVPIRQAGSLLPQLFVSGQIRRLTRQKWFWVGAGLTQAAALLLMALAAVTLEGSAAGLAIVLTLGLFSLASGVGSIAFKDVMAKTTPKGRRGALLAARASLGGALTLVAGVTLRTVLGGDDGPTGAFAALLIVAAALWVAAAMLFAMIVEPEGERQKPRSVIEEVREGATLIGRNSAFRWFLCARGLLVSVPLIVPFLALFAQNLVGGGSDRLLIFVIALGLTEVVASPLWGWVADRSAKLAMAMGGMMGVLAGGGAMLCWLLPTDDLPGWALMLIAGSFIVASGLGQAGARLGRKTYLVDGAPDDRRPLYVSVANTIIGVVTIAGAALGILAEVLSVEAVIGVLTFFACLGVLASTLMPEAERLADD